jgi:membrane-bound lytic murein transglycosylase MltF
MSEYFRGDLPEIRERGLLRVLVGFGATSFCIDGGIPRGFEYDLLQSQ